MEDPRRAKLTLSPFTPTKVSSTLAHLQTSASSWVSSPVPNLFTNCVTASTGVSRLGTRRSCSPKPQRTVTRVVAARARSVGSGCSPQTGAVRGRCDSSTSAPSSSIHAQKHTPHRNPEVRSRSLRSPAIRTDPRTIALELAGDLGLGQRLPTEQHRGTANAGAHNLQRAQRLGLIGDRGQLIEGGGVRVVVRGE